jgi:hypothetical protein
LSKDTYNEKCLFVENDDEVNGSRRNKSQLVKDFMNEERLRAIKEIRKVEKERVDELTLIMKTGNELPSSIKEALFGNNKKFCFLIKLANANPRYRMHFKLLTFLVDFYIEPEQIRAIELIYIYLIYF